MYPLIGHSPYLSLLYFCTYVSCLAPEAFELPALILDVKSTTVILRLPRVISTWTLRRHLKLNISLSNLLLPSPPYLSKQQVCPFFWYNQKLHQESSLTHFLTPASKPSVNPVGSTFRCTWGLTTVYHLFPLHPGLSYHRVSPGRWP